MEAPLEIMESTVEEIDDVTDISNKEQFSEELIETNENSIDEEIVFEATIEEEVLVEEPMNELIDIEQVPAEELTASTDD